MLTKDWSEREAKKIQREKFFEGLGSCKSYLTLCGRQCVDIALALEKGIISHQSRIMAVERETEDFTHIHEWFRKNWPGGVPGPIYSDLHKLTDLEKFDLVFLDYLGNLTYDACKWIRDFLNPQLLPSARVGITISTSQRGSVFYPALQKLLTRYYPDLCGLTGDQLVQGGYPKDVLNYAIPYVILITCYLFPNHDYTWSLHYGGEFESTHRMMLFRLMNMKPVKSKLTPLETKAQKTIDKFIKNGLHHKKIKEKKEGESVITGNQVITSKMNAQTAGQKAAATKLLNRYADQEEAKGKKRIMVIAGIKARIKRIENGNA